MTRFALVDPAAAEGVAAELLASLTAGGREAGPMRRAMANAPALLRGYLGLTRALKRSHIDRRISERIALAAQEWIGCEACLAAHSDAARALGLSEHDIALARQGTATDADVAAMVSFGLQVLVAPSEVTDAQIDELRGHGFGDEEIAEVVGVVALQLLPGAFNLIAGIRPPISERSPA